MVAQQSTNACLHIDISIGDNREETSLPLWAVKVARRLASLEDGRYNIVFTVANEYRDWTVMRVGKVEK